jgi:hypothetical protein
MPQKPAPPPEAEALGKLVYSHAAGAGNLLAGIILSLGLITGSGYLAWVRYTEPMIAGEPEPVGSVIFDWLIVVALLVGGIASLAWVIKLFTFRLYVHAEGFCYRSLGKTHLFPWTEIVEVRETISHTPLLPSRHKAVKHLGSNASRSYCIVRRDGKLFSFGPLTLPHTSVLAGPLKAAADRLEIPWHSAEQGTAEHSPARSKYR